MLEILEAKDLTPYAAYETPGVTLHAVESMTAGGCSGFAVFSYGTDTVTVYACDAKGDLALYDGIARTVLFKAMLRGIDRAKYLCDTTQLKKLHLCDPHSNKCSSIAELMNGCAGCKEKKD